MFPLLRSKVRCGYIRHPRAESLQIGCVGCLGVRVTALERLFPTAVKACHAGKQSQSITVVQHLPALHLRIVEARYAYEAENALRTLVVVEIVLSDEHKRVVLGQTVEHKDREAVNGRSHIILICSSHSSLLCIRSQWVFVVNLGINKNLVPKPCNTCIVSTRTFRIVGFQAPAVYGLRFFRERIQLVCNHCTVSVIYDRIVTLLCVNTEVLFRITH